MKPSGTVWVRTGFAALWLSACHTAPLACLLPPQPVTVVPSNIVLIVLDDVGVDKIRSYGVHPQPGRTPNLDALAARGVRFTSAYGEPSCSPSRAAMLTGRRPIHNGIGNNLRHRVSMSLDEITLPEVLSDHPTQQWSSFAVGKWHLSANDAKAATDPLDQGFGGFDGILGNAAHPYGLPPDGVDPGYFHWEHDVDGALSWSSTYLVTSQADAAITRVTMMPEPFFLYVAFSGMHVPVHIPPLELWSGGEPRSLPDIGDAMLEALDTELGRLIAAIGDRATIIVVGDNGTAAEMTRLPVNPLESKTTVHTAGVHVPLIVAGPWVEPGVRDGLVHVSDLFPTVLELAGLNPDDYAVEADSTSILPQIVLGEATRSCVVVERFGQNYAPRLKSYSFSILTDQYSLVHQKGEPDAYYARDPSQPIEGPDLRRLPMSPETADAIRELRQQARSNKREVKALWP